ncbi:unnamed protein product [Diatraea saccharalis]|uniref:Uncharacterized protein n=1 Tax=Diatraea saccharalis TaxID=40085 RepID=A0A9N9R013_9NEOP|nr:unnamed protein product [Diatraea saccharalis]
MQVITYFTLVFLIKISNGLESDSAEFNRIEISPIYDTIIFSDVIDIINELNQNLKMPIDDNSESESDDNIEDLLTEYQHYLDKAHDQRRLYLEKTNKTKNKVPLYRHENFVKSHAPPDFRYNNYYAHNYYNPSVMKFPPTSLNHPLDLFLPLTPSLRFFNKPNHMNTSQRRDIVRDSLKTSHQDKNSLYLPPSLWSSMSGPLKSLCFCKHNEVPCKCKCKECLLSSNENEPKLVNNNNKNMEYKLQEHSFIEDVMANANTLNVRIKVDVQLPNIPDSTNKYGRQYNRESAVEFEDTSKELPNSIRLPSTYFNVPIPMDVLGFKRLSKMHRYDSPLQKITIHKKKKSRSGNSNNKKHRKKLITFHNIKLSPNHSLKSMSFENHNSTNMTVKNYFNYTNVIHQEITTTNMPTFNNFTTTTYSELSVPLNTTPIEESIYLMVNISNNSENETDELQKTGNSIELEYKTVTNSSTEIPINQRVKRETASQNSSDIMKKIKSSKLLNVIGIKSKKILLKKSNMSVLSDTELLYWPSNVQNKSQLQINDLNNIILEQENKKAKLNITKETIRHNRTMALEKAIFGNIDWNDIDTIAPTFISFVGKYVHGILTFCSDTICHSMKCANATCVHRTCTPELRFNHIGHCSGCNTSDSVVSMESIMDLPSNVVFEIVDILKEKLLGKLYVQLALSKPTENSVTEGRGIGSTLWGWITYPFSWWSSNDNDQPINEQLVASTTYGPYDNIEVGRHNVTVWCNDQTCTTMKCDKIGCRNNTCNIYDTDLTGECRGYHTEVDPEKPIDVSPSEPALKPLDDNVITENTTKRDNTQPQSTEPQKVTVMTTPSGEQDIKKNQNTAETPIELEAMLSSSVTEKETSAINNDNEASSRSQLGATAHGGESGARGADGAKGKVPAPELSSVLDAVPPTDIPLKI